MYSYNPNQSSAAPLDAPQDGIIFILNAILRKLFILCNFPPRVLKISTPRCSRWRESRWRESRVAGVPDTFQSGTPFKAGLPVATRDSRNVRYLPAYWMTSHYLLLGGLLVMQRHTFTFSTRDSRNSRYLPAYWMTSHYLLPERLLTSYLLFSI